MSSTSAEFQTKKITEQNGADFIKGHEQPQIPDNFHDHLKIAADLFAALEKK
ncbi:hypothetical protein HY620_02130 [Candidatus Uhrbacteria bacterium]|nr:hypothetical protein [Candidatus Uhrbacteria bacterium]